MDEKREKPTKDEVDLVAAALGLKSSAWAQAVVHIIKPTFNFAINGKTVERWFYAVGIPTSMTDDPDLWQQLNSDIDPDYGDES